MLGTSVEEEQVAPAPRVLDRVLDELLDGSRLVRTLNLLRARAEREGSLLLLNADVSDAAVELHSQRENVIQVGAVADDETSVGFIRENFFCCLGCQSAPVPTALREEKFVNRWFAFIVSASNAKLHVVLGG